MNSISLVVPIYNEEANIRPLYDAITRVLNQLDRQAEIIFVDDGSQDDSFPRLETLAAADVRVKIIAFRRNFGQTSAMAAGIAHAQCDVIITLDGDLQNDPADIPMMLAKIDEGYDLVHGWRKRRNDAFLNRRLPSIIANWIIARVTGFPVHDLGCTLKAVRREIAQELELYGEMHRFIPILGHWRGARCIEVETNHHPRRFGVSKYGISRTVRVIMDLITVKYLIRYLVSPMKLFGLIGLACGGVGALSGLATLYMKFAHGSDMTGNPLFTLSVFSLMVGVQFFGLGLIGELGARIYYQVHVQDPYAIRRTVNMDAPAVESTPPPVVRRAA